ncbi:Uncharacterised protein [Klebsiella pneumoniae]|nr:Uncharacterised protein [Klebsiella pneumoniae]SXU27921.1 Uncharacterised protein [Klebsiella pneumoniae]
MLFSVISIWRQIAGKLSGIRNPVYFLIIGQQSILICSGIPVRKEEDLMTKQPEHYNLESIYDEKISPLMR